MKRLIVFFLTLTLAFVLACATGSESKPGAADFLAEYERQFETLYQEASEAQWQANTRIVEGDDSIRKRAEASEEALAAFLGSIEIIERTRELLEREDLTPLERRQLEGVLYSAANYPQTEPELVKKRIAAEAKQVEKLFGFTFRIGDDEVTANDIDDILVSSRDLEEREQAWDASKEVGKELKSSLAELVDLRNRSVRSLDFDDYFGYQVADYGMSSDELMGLMKRFVRELWPLYRELHTWARHELAARYGEEVPEMLPAHWLPNRWGQDWAAMVQVEGIDLDAVLADKDPEWIVRQAEAFYISLGFDPLPDIFWERSSLYPLPEDAEYKKNNHASAWHLDRRQDVRSLMSVQPNERWWNTTHHELGHIYYYLSYSRPEVPLILRAGANRAFHEAVGTLLGFASMQKPFLVEKGLIGADVETDEIQSLLKEALDAVVFIPFSAGTMTHFEHDLYAEGLEEGEYNQRWWDHVRRFQGIVPPTERGEEYCDAASKTHINDDAAQYYDYALSHIILHQLHAHIAKNLLQQDPRGTSYLARREVGDFLRGILAPGATEDWREVMERSLGQEISAAPMLAYFEPLTAFLKEQNEGRGHTLPESPEV